MKGDSCDRIHEGPAGWGYKKGDNSTLVAQEDPVENTYPQHQMINKLIEQISSTLCEIVEEMIDEEFTKTLAKENVTNSQSAGLPEKPDERDRGDAGIVRIR